MTPELGATATLVHFLNVDASIVFKEASIAAFFILHCSKRLIVTYLCIYIPVDKLIRFVMVKTERVKRVTIWKPMKIKRTSENEIAQMKKSTL